MGNDQSAEHSRALVRVEEQNRDLARLRQELENQKHAQEIRDIKHERDVLESKLELMKTLTLLREDAARREQEQRDYIHKLIVIIGVLVMFAVWLKGQNDAAIGRNSVTRQ